MSMAPGLPLLPMVLGLTAAFPGALATQEVWQSPPYTITGEGGSIHITCSIHIARETLQGVYLKRHYWPEPANVIYYEDGKEPTVSTSFWDRITFSGPQHNLTITMHSLQPTDTGAYYCQAFTKDDEVWGPGTLVVVTDTVSPAADTCQGAQLTHFALCVTLAVGFLLVGLGLGAMCVLMRTQIRKLCPAKDRSTVSVVYEDMSRSRHNTMSAPNQYP